MRIFVVLLNAGSGAALIVSSISAFISAVAVVVAIYFNQRTRKQYMLSLEPQLSMRIDRHGGFLYLFVQNTGKTVAKNINLAVHSLKGNGPQEKLWSNVYADPFELYPNESAQAIIAICGENVATRPLYPSASVDVSYTIPGKDREEKYERTITLSRVFDQIIHAKVGMDLGTIESALMADSRAMVRVANYLDGHQVIQADELNILAEESLRNDLCEVIETGKKERVKDRAQTIHESLNNASIHDKERNQ